MRKFLTVLAIILTLALFGGIGYFAYTKIEQKRALKPEEKMVMKKVEEEKLAENEKVDEIKEEEVQNIEDVAGKPFLYIEGIDVVKKQGVDTERKTMGLFKPYMFNRTSDIYYIYSPDKKELYKQISSDILEPELIHRFKEGTFLNDDHITGLVEGMDGEPKYITVAGTNGGIYEFDRNAIKVLTRKAFGNFYSILEYEDGFVVGGTERLAFMDKEFNIIYKIDTAKPVKDIKEDGDYIYALIDFSEDKDVSLLMKIDKETKNVEDITEIKGHESSIFSTNPLSVISNKEIVEVKDAKRAD